MNSANATLAFEQTKKSGSLRELLAFVGLPSKRLPRDLSESAVEVLHGIMKILDGILQRAIGNRTAVEFDATRDEVFPDYFSTVLALSRLVRVIVPASTIERLTWESFSELEADLRDQGLARFGAAAKDQAIFTVWTLRKVYSMVSRFTAGSSLPPDCKAADEKLSCEFTFYWAWTQFHLDCLKASIQSDRALHPEVLAEVIDGLRAAVNVYGLARQGVDLREPPKEETLEAYAWDEEDQELLDSSMRHIEAEPI